MRKSNKNAKISMSDFEEWYEDFKRDGNNAVGEELAREAWNKAVNKFHLMVATETTVYDSLGPAGDRIDSIKTDLIANNE